MVAPASHLQSARWGDTVNGCKHFPLHRAQSDVLRSTRRFRAAIAGTGGGKTAIGPLFLMQQIERVLGERDVTRPGQGIMLGVVTPTYKIMSRATAPTFVDAFQGTMYEGSWGESKSLYTLPNGWGRVWCMSADNPNSVEAGQFDGMWVDEGGQIKRGAWIAIQGRVGMRQAPVLITTTPYGQNWLFHDVFKRWKGGDANYYVRQWSSNANPAYSTEEYERAKGVMSQQRAAMRYDGQFVKMAGLVYPDLDSCFFTDRATFDRVSALPRRVGGVDFGFQDPFAALCASLDEDNHLWVWYERYKSRQTISEHVKHMPEGAVWYCDPSRPDSIAELRKADRLARRAVTNDIELGIDAVTKRIYEGTLHVWSGCRALRAESEEYRYPEKDDEVSGDRPVDEMNHALDTLRYLVVSVDRGNVGSRTRRAEAATILEDDDGQD